MDFTRQGNMTVNSMFPTCFNPGNLLLSFQTNFYRIISWKPAIFHSVKQLKAPEERQGRLHEDPSLQCQWTAEDLGDPVGITGCIFKIKVMCGGQS